MLKRLLLVLTFSLFCLAPLYAQTDAAKTADIKRLMEITDSAATANQFASAITEQMFMALKAGNPEISDRAIEAMGTEMKNLFTEKMAAPNGLLDQIIPIYDKYFTHDEIKQLLAFYESPIGKKTVEVLPKITTESMAVGQKWGEALAPEIQTRIFKVLKEEGLLPEGM